MAEQQNPAQMVAQQQSLDAATEYKNAWDSAPSTGGAGQFPTQGPFGSQTGGLTADASKAMSAAAALPSTPAAPASPAPAAPAAVPAATPNVINAAIDALPETAAGAVTNTTPAGGMAAQNVGTNPYVGSTSTTGEVGRQDTRPARLAIDDTMSPDEQYRRQWINESNGWYGLEVDKVAPEPAPAPVAEAPAAPAPPPKPIEYGVSFNGPTDAGDGGTTVYDVATGRPVKTFDGEEGNALYRRLGGVGTVNSDQLKEYTGWSAPVAEKEQA